jgi:hypothetical protein
LERWAHHMMSHRSCHGNSVSRFLMGVTYIEDGLSSVYGRYRRGWEWPRGSSDTQHSSIRLVSFDSNGHNKSTYKYSTSRRRSLFIYIHLDLSFLSVTYTCEISSLYSLLWVVFLFRVRQSMTDRVTLIYSKTYYTLLMMQWEIFNAYHQLKEAEKKGSRKKYVVIKNWYEKKGTTTTENRK